MIKKQYIQPSTKAIELGPCTIICGSGDGTEGMSLGDPNNGEAPGESTQGGFTGIFGEAKGTSAFGDMW